MSGIPELKSQYIWVVILLVYIGTGIFPLGSPFQMSTATVDAYNYVQTLKPGSICVLGGGNVFAFDLESSAAMIAAVKQIARQGLRMVEFPTAVEGITFHHYCVDAARVDEKFGGPWRYGRDYVYLPYVAGGTAVAVVAFLTNVHATVSTDIFGTPIDQIPLMKDFHDYKDMALWFMPHWAAETYSPYIVGERGVPMMYFSQAQGYVAAAVYMNIYPGKMWVTNGFLGGAQYEQLMGYSGIGHAAVDSYSVLSIVVLGFVVLGNLRLLSGVSEKKQVEAKQ